MGDFKKAMRKVQPSVSKEDEMTYAKLQNSLKKARAHIEDE
jgi:SpoVK/Ycf46/Vps4 family AAA+-type ATPase